MPGRDTAPAVPVAGRSAIVAFALAASLAAIACAPARRASAGDPSAEAGRASSLRFVEVAMVAPAEAASASADHGPDPLEGAGVSSVPRASRHRPDRRRPADRAARARAGTARPLVMATLEVDGIADAVAPPYADVVPARWESAVAESSAAKGIGANDDTLVLATGLGRIEPAASAGTLNGQPAAALHLALKDGPLLVDTAGVAEMTNLSEPGGFRKTFKVSTRASIPLD